MENSQQKNPQPANQSHTNQKDQKPKQTRTRKTIDQELADLEARKQKLLESKRKAETREKIIFAATVIAMLKELQKRGDENSEAIAQLIIVFTKKERAKDIEIIKKIINPILEIKPDKKQQEKQNKQEQSQHQ